MASGLRIHGSLHHAAAREWQEPHIHASSLIYPIFVTSKPKDIDIEGFSPNKQWGTDEEGNYAGLVEHLKELEAKGLRAVMLFGVTGSEEKDAVGSASDRCCDDGDHADGNTPLPYESIGREETLPPSPPSPFHIITATRRESAGLKATPVIRAMKRLRVSNPNLMLCADVCLCEYTDHGHCGPQKKDEGSPDGELIIDNHAAVQRMADSALAYAKAGAHMVCPSDMMDGRIGAIKDTLVANGFEHVAIMSYTSKKASCMYAPFRAAVDSTFKGDRKRYQQPVGASKIAGRALRRDLDEGADFVLVKPALFYGDIISEFAKTADVPVAVYIVSGEYKMLTDYGNSTGTLEAVVKESHVGMLRSGASILITYFAPHILDWIPKW